MKRAPESLCRRLTRETLTLLLVFQLIVFSVGGALIVWPLLNTSVADFARVMQSAADRWRDAASAASVPTRDAEAVLWLQSAAPAALRPSYLPYVHVLSRRLTADAGQPVAVRADPQGRYWARLPRRSGGDVWIGFDAERVGTRPPLMLAVIAFALIGLALAFSVMVARRMTQPLGDLIRASTRLGQGDTSVRVPETGPREIAALAQAFNTLAAQLRELLDNRATLLIGLAHDLRTPLTRLRLALEMLDPARDDELSAGMERDLDALKDLLDNVFALEQGLHLEQGRRVRIDAVVADVVTAHQSGHAVDYTEAVCATEVSELALRRVLENLIENAARYGGPAPITVTLACADGIAVVEVVDRGQGIPVDQRAAVLRPFYRLDASRSAAAGGSGLGLAIVQQICRAQGWTITLGEREGGGLRAVVTIAAVRA